MHVWHARTRGRVALTAADSTENGPIALRCRLQIAVLILASRQARRRISDRAESVFRKLGLDCSDADVGTVATRRCFSLCLSFLRHICLDRHLEMFVRSTAY